MTVTEVAQVLDISTSGVYKLIERGKLPAIRRSERGLRVSRLALDAYQRRLQHGSAPMPISYSDAPLDKLIEEFQDETKLSPYEWERRWKTGQIEDSAENMQFSIRALSLLLREQGKPSDADDRQAEPASAHRSAA